MSSLGLSKDNETLAYSNVKNDTPGLQEQINALSTDISQLNIGNITTDIATNTTDIATNTTNIATNTTDIATNATNITTNTADIATNTTNITTINNKFPQYYKTLIYRQKVDGNNLFASLDDAKEFNNTISTPLSSNKFSIMNSIEDIKGNINAYVFMLKVIPDNGNIIKSSEYAIDLKEDGKNIVVVSQEFNPIQCIFLPSYSML